MSQAVKKAPIGRSRILREQPLPGSFLPSGFRCLPLSGVSFCMWPSGPSFAWGEQREWFIPLDRTIRALTASDVIGRRRVWDDVDAQIAAWSDLPADWDGEDGRAPSGGVTGAAREMVQRLREACAPAPKPYVAGDGEVGLRWQGHNSYASASFVDDGDVLLYMHVGDEVRHNFDGAWADGVDTSPFIADLPLIA